MNVNVHIETKENRRKRSLLRINLKKRILKDKEEKQITMFDYQSITYTLRTHATLARGFGYANLKFET